MSAFEKAWQFLKTDFSDIAPFPTRYKFVPEGVPYQPPTEEEQLQRLNFFAREPQNNQRYMEEDYMPDLQEMLELEAIRQASGQQVPRNLIREEESFGSPYSGVVSAFLNQLPNIQPRLDGPRHMMNVPLDRQNLPLQE